MRKFLGTIFALSLALSVASCKDASKEIEKFADAACACENAECADKVLEDFAKFAKENKNARGDQERANAAGQKLGKCLVEKGVDTKKLMDTLSELAK